MLHDVSVNAYQFLLFGMDHQVHGLKGKGAQKHGFGTGDNYGVTGCFTVFPADFHRKRYCKCQRIDLEKAEKRWFLTVFSESK